MKKKNIKHFLIFVAIIISISLLPIAYARYEQTINKTLTINVRKPSYTVKFNSNRNDGNEDEVTSQDFVYGTKQKLNKNTFTKEDEDFCGWNTKRNGSGTSYEDEQEVDKLSSEDGAEIVLYAQWGEADYWVTYVFGNESFNGTKYLNSGIPLFSNDNVHRDFEISMDVSNFSYLSGQDTDRNVLLCNQYEVASPYQGFAMQHRENQIKIQVNCTDIAEVSNPWGKTEGGITFKRTNDVLYQDGEMLYDFGNRITTFNMPLSFGANLDQNGNPRRFSIVDLSNITIKLKYSYEEYLVLCQNLPTPEKSSYNFKGWYSDPENGTKITTKEQLDAAGRIIYPHWQEITIKTITFAANGGSGNMNKQYIDYNTSDEINANEFTREGYNFVGWNTKGNGTGTGYADGANITLTDDITLYAQWLSIPKQIFTADNIQFDGSYLNIVDTGMYLFSAENIHKNFEVSFEITSINTNKNETTIINTKDESGAPYPGFVLRINSSKKLNLKADSTASNSFIKNNMALNSIQKLSIIRINDVTYYSINDANYQTMLDFSNIARTFDAPLALGGIIKPNGGREREFKGTLSNVVVKFIEDTATLEDYQNALPSP